MNKGQNTLEALLNFYLFWDIEDESLLDIYLEQNDLDIDSISENLSKHFKQKKAELKLEQGEQFKKAYQTQVPTEKSSPDSLTQNLHMLAARNQKEGFNEMERKDLLTEQEKLKLIAKLKNQNEKPHP